MSDYFALWVMQEIMQHHIFLRLPMERLAQLQLVSRRWRDMILDPGFARLRYQTEVAARRSLEVPQSLLVVPNVGGSLGHIEVSRLVSENHGGFRPAYFPISCDGIGFPVDSLVGSCEGLVCLLDDRQEIFVINPLLGRSRRVMQTGLPHVAIGFGAVVLRDVRSFVVLQALDTNLERFVFFNLTTNQWRVIEHHYGQGDWHYDIQQGETVAFAHENFIFQGRIIRGNNVQQALIFYNLCENSFQHIELDREISSHRLQLGVIGPNIAALWGLDDDISRRLRCFWRIDITRLRRYEFNPIAPNPLLQNFEPRHPMSFAGPNQVLMLCRDEWLELCKDGALQRGELHLVHPVLPGWRVGRLQAIAFTRTFVLPGVNANDDNVQTDQQHLPSLRTLDGVPTLGKPFEPLDDANFLRTQLDQQKGVDNLVSNTNLLESEIREARSKKDTFKAHSQSARSATKVSEMVGNVDTSSALSAFDKMEEKVLAMESQAEALGQLNTDTDDLEGKVESSSVGDANLKKELSGSSKNGA